MNCNNCGTVNAPNSKFCIKCGSALVAEQPVQNVQPQVAEQPVQSVQPQVAVQPQPVENVQPQVAVQPVVNNNVSTGTLDYVSFVIALLLKPFQAFKEEESKFNDIKVAGIFSGIVAALMMACGLLSSMISAMFVKTLDPSTFKFKTTFSFDGLKNLDYVSLIFKNLLIYAVIILIIAGVYYIGTLILKKTVSFSKLLAGTASSIVPCTLLSMLVAPILGKIWTPLSIIVLYVGFVYSIIIFVSLMNDLIGFESNDIKIKFNTICITILVLGGGYAYYKIMLNQVASSISGLSGLMF